MDPGAPLVNDVHSPTQRQSILGSFLRVRPRGTSQSHQAPQNLQLDPSQESPVAAPSGNGALVNGISISTSNSNNNSNMPTQPPSPNPNNPGHRRRPAAGALQASVSNGFSVPLAPGGAGGAVHGLSQILRRRRSANGAINLSTAPTASMGAAHSPVDAGALALAARPPNAGTGPTHRIRLVPHLDSNRSLHFEPISRDVREGDGPLRIGRFTDRSGMGVAALNAQNTNKLAFKSKVVSRAHAEVWCESGGKFFIKDTKSSSGTFLNHIRLSAPNADSNAFPLKDGDVLQLGVDYQGGTEEIYKCVKMRIELGREWQSQANAFNTNALKQLKALSAQPSAGGKQPSKLAVSKSGISDCCICLFSVTVHQSLFIAPCSHVFHYKCIRPMLLMHHPGFSCPLCRTFANLEDDVEIDIEDADTSDNADGTEKGGSSAEGANAAGRNAMDVDAVSHVNAVLNAANEAAAHINGGGAETEVERDFAPPNYRRRDGGATLRNSNNSPSPARNHFEDVPEDADEYALMAETDGEFGGHFDDENDGDALMLPPLPVPSPSMQHLAAVPVPNASFHPPAAGTSTSAPSQMQGIAIMRPMSVPVPGIGVHGMVLDDASDGDGEHEGDEFEMVGGPHDDASGSSGEGAVGAGGKRKR